MAERRTTTKPATGPATPSAAPQAATPAAEPAVQTTALAKPGGLLAKVPRVTDIPYQLMELNGPDGGEIAEAFRANLGGSQLSAFDFQRIRVPAGGGLAWTVRDPETDQETPATTVSGIIVAFKDQKAYWPKSLSEEGAKSGPPQCYSPDTIKGIGDPGTICAKCPYNKFGTARNNTGRGKACKDTRFLFVMFPDSILPQLIIVPPTSLQNVRQYMINLSSRGLHYWRVITRFALVSDKNADGTKYSKVDVKYEVALDGPAKDAAKTYSDMIRGMLGMNPGQALPMSQADLGGPANAEGFGAEGEFQGEVIPPNVNPGTGEVLGGSDWDRQAEGGEGATEGV